jgi:hypothetical protein
MDTATDVPTSTATETTIPTMTASATSSPLPTNTATATAVASATATPPACIGDCNGNMRVTIDELLRGVRISLGEGPVSLCPAVDRNGSGEVTVDELVTAVDNALRGCPAPSASSR